MSGNYEERDLLKVLPVQYVGGGQFDLDTGRDQRRYDFTASAIYVGAAPAGAATSAASWTIKKIGLDAGGNVHRRSGPVGTVPARWVINGPFRGFCGTKVLYERWTRMPRLCNYLRATHLLRGPSHVAPQVASRHPRRHPACRRLLVADRPEGLRCRSDYDGLQPLRS